MIPSPFIQSFLGNSLVFGSLILLSGCSRLEKTVSGSKTPKVQKAATEKELKVSKNGTRSPGENWLGKNEKGLLESFCRLEL
jgi:hypothetical protein